MPRQKDLKKDIIFSYFAIDLQSMAHALDRLVLDIVMKAGVTHDYLDPQCEDKNIINGCERKMGLDILDVGYS